MRLRTRRRAATTPRGWSAANIIRENNAVAHWDPSYGVMSDGSWRPRLGGTTLSPVGGDGLDYSAGLANLNGRPGWIADGTNYLQSGAANAFAATLDSYALIVVSYTINVAPNVVVGLSNATGYVLSHNIDSTGYMVFEDYDGTYSSGMSNTPRTATLSVDSWWFDKSANTLQFSNNNTDQGTRTGLTGNVTPDRIVLGARYTGAIEYFLIGSIGDVVILQNNTQANIQAVAAALMLKYGI